MRSVTSFNAGWVFHEDIDELNPAELRPGRKVDIPHTAIELPYDYFDETVYQRAFSYQKILTWRSEFDGQDVRLVFDGAMADSTVYLNGNAIQSHTDGYTPFEARLTPYLHSGDNVITVRIDGRESPDIPPFGGQIDFLTYAGIYRDAWLKITDPVSIDRLAVRADIGPGEIGRVAVDCHIVGHHRSGGPIRVAGSLTDPSGNEVAAAESVAGPGETVVTLRFHDLDGIARWDLDCPNLYAAVVELTCPGGCDRLAAGFGFRSARFTPDGFFLNDRPVKIRGLNRHQSYPYAGYAMGRRAQERDAETLRHELGCNLVRTSHYPQSPWFLDHCDRIGLLVFEEIPGWQHIGGSTWKQRSIDTVRRMIERDANHPSIVLWGVRINESADDHRFYVDTNNLARSLDPTRQTAGVRNFTGSEFLEDVYTMNDFVLGSARDPLMRPPRSNLPDAALREPREVTCLDRDVPYLVTEYNGHMYPTRRTDPEERQIEHVTRHLQVLDAAMGMPGVSGCVGWCMADYNTHKDFGSGDRICHHGVLDMFREPKFAAYAYASQRSPDDGIVLKPVTVWARGERAIGGAIPLMVLTNCDDVAFRLGDGPTRRAQPDRDRFPNLPHPPVIIDTRHLSPDELGRWGKAWYDLQLTGFIGGLPVREVRMVADPVPTRLQVDPDARDLLASEPDVVRVAVRTLDQVGNLLTGFSDPLSVTLDGPATLIGPQHLTFRGGVAAFWLRSVPGQGGQVTVRIETSRFDPAEIRLEAR
ncbi:MAG: glycoside hydrolase family 2 protein [Paracoccaceae bacterium]|nr:glycoside hydrolase family 2 protein [Paracoccaceae bacterium]MDE2914736.1 glycoside hydrolase family 2 protein [Paracoccaceae bacterium]